MNDKDKVRQKELDATISRILESHHYDELGDLCFSKVLSADAFEPKAYSGMPAKVLAATIELHKQLRDKWLERADGWRFQEEVVSAAFQKAGLNLLRLHRDHCRCNADLAEKAIASISNYIADLENYYDEVVRSSSA